MRDGKRRMRLRTNAGMNELEPGAVATGSLAWTTVKNYFQNELIHFKLDPVATAPGSNFPSLWEGLGEGLRRFLFLFLKEASTLTSNTQMPSPLSTLR